MSSVCFYFQVHQPFRLRPFRYFDQTEKFDYFDESLNGEILNKVAQKCYLPTNALMLELIEKHAGRFRISYSISGVAIEQFKRYSPETLESFQRLADTGAVEFLGETYYHSLSAVYHKEEFLKQVEQHAELTCELFGQKPQVFRNTELIYSDEIGKIISELDYRAVIAEGADDILGWRSPNFIYSMPQSDVRLLVKNYRLSDDIAFRFSNRSWASYPLTAERFADWVHRISGAGDIVNLFMDYETFGEHQWADSGIFEFLSFLPDYVLRHPDWDFKTPSEVVDSYPAVADLNFPRLTSWADMERDLTAWRGNEMQENALREIYELCDQIERIGDETLSETWRKLQTSDHFYYMCTKWFADGDVHAYFSPYDSPYDAFINYMNIFRNFKDLVQRKASQCKA